MPFLFTMCYGKPRHTDHAGMLTHTAKLALVACWVRTLTKCPLDGLFSRKWLSDATVENGTGDNSPGGGTLQAPPNLKGGRWGGGDPNGVGRCAGLPGRYMFMFKTTDDIAVN